jgi:hypothetical protein
MSNKRKKNCSISRERVISKAPMAFSTSATTLEEYHSAKCVTERALKLIRNWKGDPEFLHQLSSGGPILIESMDKNNISLQTVPHAALCIVTPDEAREINTSLLKRSL